jgi:hypothetical protein
VMSASSEPTSTAARAATTFACFRGRVLADYLAGRCKISPWARALGFSTHGTRVGGSVGAGRSGEPAEGA